jgi:hypothetical protein
LCRRCSSSQKGGTLIATAVHDLTEHERRLACGAYRPEACPRCGQPLHIHDYRTRVLAGDEASCTEIVRFRCADRDLCGAVWQVLPALLARQLWRAWRTVEGAVAEPVRASTAEIVPARTRRRWRARLAASAAALVVLLSTAFDMAEGLHVETRSELVLSFSREAQAPRGQRLARLAELIHRCAPGVRLM